jgi:CRISPR-associated RAMP protein (TIGR02581 family)
MLRKWLCQADVTIHLEPVDPVLIKSGYATLDGPDMVPVQTLRDGKETYYFPGTSLKGVLRSHFERIARTLHEGSVCLPYYDPKKVKDISLPVDSAAERQAAVGCGYRELSNENENTTAAIYRESCAACRLFGSLRFGGRFGIGDAYPVPGMAQPQKSHRNGVGIDRFTGGTVHGVLFDLVVLEGGTFETKLRMVNFELWQLAALHFLLIDLQDEIISIGSGRSRGLGRVRGSVQSYTLTYVRAGDMVRGLYDLANADERQQYGLYHVELPGPIALPAATRHGLRHVHDVTADWQSRLAPLAGSLERFLSWHKGPQGTVKK